MDSILQFISQPWHWAPSGVMIVVVMFLLLWGGGEFGVSSNLRTLCAMGGAGNKFDFFNFDWKSQLWNLTFIAGAVIGGYIAVTAFQSDDTVQISEATQSYLLTKGISTPANIHEGLGFVPQELYGVDSLGSLPSMIVLVIGGLLIGFGTRWAGGCTSGHAISGLSNLQLPSLIAVVGFFIGGLAMTHFILPLILTL